MFSRLFAAKTQIKSSYSPNGTWSLSRATPGCDLNSNNSISNSNSSKQICFLPLNTSRVILLADRKFAIPCSETKKRTRRRKTEGRRKMMLMSEIRSLSLQPPEKDPLLRNSSTSSTNTLMCILLLELSFLVLQRKLLAYDMLVAS